MSVNTKYHHISPFASTSIVYEYSMAQYRAMRNRFAGIATPLIPVAAAARTQSGSACQASQSRGKRGTRPTSQWQNKML
jgi:hypothetical protein